MTTWEPFVAALLAFAVLALAVSSISRLLACAVVRHRSSAERSAARVSILKPLCGAEPSLSENLQRFSLQTHQNLQIVFGVADPEDPALPAAKRFCQQHAQLATRISIGEDSRLHNPKLALLERMSQVCHGEWLVVSDSNVRVGDSYVQDALAHAAPDVGLITHLVAGGGGGSLAAHLENLQLNCFVAPGVCGVRWIVGRTCVVGKSMFIRREALARIGGFEAAGQFLAEDYVLGRAMEKAGYRVVTAAVPIVAWHEDWTMARFMGRHLRWAVMRRRVCISAYLAEVLLTPAPALLVLLALGSCFPATGINVAWVGLGVMLEQLLDALTFSRMRGRCVPLVSVLINPLRQCLTLWIWVLGWFVQVVEWRGQVYRVGSGSKLEPVQHVSVEVADEA
jgi:ceramide glucosyltransferase